MGTACQEVESGLQIAAPSPPRSDCTRFSLLVRVHNQRWGRRPVPWGRSHPPRARPLSPLAGRQDLTCVGKSSARSSSPSPSLATIALPMSAPSVRSASRWIAGCRRIAGGVQARWGARPAGGTLYTGPATIAVTWRRPPTRAPLLHRRPPRAPAGRLPSSLPPGPSRVRSALSLRRPGDPGAAGGRPAPPAPGGMLYVFPRRAVCRLAQAAQ